MLFADCCPLLSVQDELKEPELADSLRCHYDEWREQFEAFEESLEEGSAVDSEEHSVVGSEEGEDLGRS